MLLQHIKYDTLRKSLTEIVMNYLLPEHISMQNDLHDISYFHRPYEHFNACLYMLVIHS